MSGYVVPELWCDGSGCATKLWSDYAETLRELRAVGRDLGWRRLRVDGELIDLCPECEVSRG